MQEITLIKLSLSISIIGLILLFILSFFPDKPLIKDNDINLYGYVISVKHYPKITRIVLLASEKEIITVFGNVSVKDSDKLLVYGVKQGKNIYATGLVRFKK